MKLNFEGAQMWFRKAKIWLLNPANRKQAYIIGGILATSLIVFIWLLATLFLSNVKIKEAKAFYIYDNYTLDSIANKLHSEQLISKEGSFRTAAGLMGLNDKNIRVGRYKIEPGFGNFTLVRMFKNGLQTPVKITLNNIRTIEELAGKLGSYLKSDSTTFMHLFRDTTFLSKHSLDSETVMTAFLPDTYEMYWDTKPDEVFEKFLNVTNKFWNKQRLAKADSLQLTPQQVYTLASIVEKETNKVDERPDVAGVYLNRFHQNMPLQADPTVVFANNDFTIKRVTGKHTAIDSPYNTYKYTGLPPGPICMPEKSSIDAVLNATNHDYMFFCAKPDLSGYHSFAVTFQQHVQNAKAYRDFLDKNGY